MFNVNQAKRSKSRRTDLNEGLRTHTKQGFASCSIIRYKHRALTVNQTSYDSDCCSCGCLRINLRPNQYRNKYSCDQKRTDE
jgi:hypothetical protein